jgi:hypothetical protein
MRITTSLALSHIASAPPLSCRLAQLMIENQSANLGWFKSGRDSLRIPWRAAHGARRIPQEANTKCS